MQKRKEEKIRRKRGGLPLFELTKLFSEHYIHTNFIFITTNSFELDP
jgi:hypothetical protein